MRFVLTAAMVKMATPVLAETTVLATPETLTASMMNVVLAALTALMRPTALLTSRLAAARDAAMPCFAEEFAGAMGARSGDSPWSRAVALRGELDGGCF